jgi:coenzyme F420 hydrogenase subunit beta
MAAGKCQSLTTVLKADTCSGCGACASLAPLAITMELGDRGYARPRQVADVSVEVDRTIAEVCPGYTLTQSNTEGVDHVLWGPIVKSRTGFSTDAKLRHHASSGGGLSALLVHLLKTGQVDHVIHVHANGQSPLDNAIVVSETYDDVFKGAGSRYAPSSPLENIHRYLDMTGTFALVGKPCDIAAARAMAKADSRIDQKIPFMLSFFCAGIPARKGTVKVIEKLGVAEKDVASFRYRGDGWPGFATAVTKSGESKRMSYADSWGSILSHFVQPRCKICADGTGAAADVVCADAWESDEKGYPKFSELEGQSMIISRTAKGERLVGEAMASGAVSAVSLDVADIAQMQPGQYRRKRLVLSRILAMRVVLTGVPKYSGFQLLKAARVAGIGENIRSFLGMLRRLVLS